MERKKVVFIVNPISGKGRQKEFESILSDNLDSSGFSFSVVFTKYAAHAKDLAREAVSSGADIVAAVGGDGTVNEVASVVAGGKSTLAIIPYGSGNGLARHLGIPLEPEKAVRLINNNNTDTVDYGTVNGRPFFCTCGMGLDARVSERFSKMKRRGFLSYVKCVLKEWWSFKGELFYLNNGGEDYNGTVSAILLTVANASQWGNNARIAPEASVKDGLLDIVAIRSVSFFKAPVIALKLFGGKLKNKNNGNYMSIRLKDFSITRTQGGYIHLDGEPVWEEPVLFFKTCTSGLRILR